MPRILIAECMQEISSFNPLPSDYANFAIQMGQAIFAQRPLNSGLGGALAVFDSRPDVTVVPAMSARAGSAGLLSAAGWTRLQTELLEAVRAALHDIDGIYVSLHGAMGADGELDPEGALLEAIRAMAGPGIPIVISLDLHGILTDRMLRQVDGLAIYHTYPHVDFAGTCARAARLLLRLLDAPHRPVIARVVIPALVRGDELITRTGCYGDLIRECQRLERDGTAMAAGVMIGNPFTDVPELCSQAVVMTDNDPVAAEREALRLANEFWPGRARMQGKFIGPRPRHRPSQDHRRPGAVHGRRGRHVLRRHRGLQPDPARGAGTQLRQARPPADCGRARRRRRAPGRRGRRDRGHARRHQRPRPASPPCRSPRACACCRTATRTWKPWAQSSRPVRPRCSSSAT